MKPLRRTDTAGTTTTRRPSRDAHLRVLGRRSRPPGARQIIVAGPAWPGDKTALLEQVLAGIADSTYPFRSKEPTDGGPPTRLPDSFLRGLYFNLNTMFGQNSQLLNNNIPAADTTLRSVLTQITAGFGPAWYAMRRLNVAFLGKNPIMRQFEDAFIILNHFCAPLYTARVVQQVETLAAETPNRDPKKKVYTDLLKTDALWIVLHVVFEQLKRSRNAELVLDFGEVADILTLRHAVVHDTASQLGELAKPIDAPTRQALQAVVDKLPRRLDGTPQHHRRLRAGPLRNIPGCTELAGHFLPNEHPNWDHLAAKPNENMFSHPDLQFMAPLHEAQPASLWNIETSMRTGVQSVTALLIEQGLVATGVQRWEDVETRLFLTMRMAAIIAQQLYAHETTTNERDTTLAELVQLTLAAAEYHGSLTTPAQRRLEREVMKNHTQTFLHYLATIRQHRLSRS